MPAIHDPIHGTIELSVPELRLIDSWPFQRLRHIKQLGFSELAFPGATHSRYAHSLGAMQMATFMVDHILAGVELSAADRKRMRQLVRLAVLFHDIGHAPMSHVSERVMPELAALGLGEWADDPERQATHEDYTVKLLIDSELTGLIDEHFGELGISGSRLAGLVMGRNPPGDSDAFRAGGSDLLPLLHQIVSSEMDADRMDYLRRDAYYCGVSYGHYDHLWLTQNLSATEWEGKLTMALHHKGVWAFENFLLARYHMFLSVYYHHTAICFDHLLGRFYESGKYTLPAETEAYLRTDDVALMNVLRASDDPWAKAVVRRRAYRLALETHAFGSDDEREQIDMRLRDAEIDFFRTTSKGVLSKYFSKRDTVFPLIVIERERGRFSRIEDYTPLYRRFQEHVAVERIYCRPEHLSRARELLAS
ncbi:MAG: HD domain-containing protein [Myxococcota bacterium]